VGAHVGTAEEYLQRHIRDVQRDLWGNDGIPTDSLLNELHARVSDSRNLRVAAEHVLAGGAGSGIDGVHGEHLDHRAVFDLIGRASRALRTMCYQPRREKCVAIPKVSGGTRWLSIPTIADRVVQRAFQQIIDPVIDPSLGIGVFGGRSGLSCGNALAMAERCVSDGNPYLVIVDIRTAFDTVPLDRLVGIIRARLGKTKLTKLMTRMIRQHRKIGIGQGSPLSPLLLNLFLDHVLDRPIAKRHPSLRLIRYLDDILVACPDRKTAERTCKDLQTLLKSAGMSLKTEPAKAVVDIRQTEADWLGFTLTHGPTGLEARIGAKAWKKLQTDLSSAHDSDHPCTEAAEPIRGWLHYLGPCWHHASRTESLKRVCDLAAAQGFGEVAAMTELETLWRQAGERYAQIRAQAMRRPTRRRQRQARQNRPKASPFAFFEMKPSRMLRGLVTSASSEPVRRHAGLERATQPVGEAIAHNAGHSCGQCHPWPPPYNRVPVILSRARAPPSASPI
jgi:hypothetical protein